VLTYERTKSAKPTASRPAPATSAAEDFGWKDPSKKGKKAQQAAPIPSEDAIKRFEERQAEREKALVKQAKVSRLPFCMEVSLTVSSYTANAY
jgi:hypothetical protein